MKVSIPKLLIRPHYVVVDFAVRIYCNVPLYHYLCEISDKKKIPSGKINQLEDMLKLIHGDN